MTGLRLEDGKFAHRFIICDLAIRSIEHDLKQLERFKLKKALQNIYEEVLKELIQEDYDLGDIATNQNLDWSVTMDARITEIKEIHQGNGFSIEATFGNSRPTFIQKIKQELSQISGEVRR